MLGQRLKFFAQERFGSVQGLSEATGIGRTQISSYTSGARSPSVEVLEKFLAAGCDLNWLVGGVGSMVYSCDDKPVKADHDLLTADEVAALRNLLASSSVKKKVG